MVRVENIAYAAWMEPIHAGFCSNMLLRKFPTLLA